MCIAWLSSFITYFALIGLTDLGLFSCLEVSATIFITLTILNK